MFFRKKKILSLPDPMSDYAVCSECKGLFARNSMQVLNTRYKLMYCKLHTKPYNRVGYKYLHDDKGRIISSVDIYYKEFEVDQLGTPVGYKKEEEYGNDF